MEKIEQEEQKKIRKLTFEVDLNKVKSREQFLGLLDKVLKYDFIGFYNGHGIVNYLFRKEEKLKKEIASPPMTKVRGIFATFI